MRACGRPPTELRLADDSELQELRPATSTAHHATHLGNYTQLLFAKSDDMEAISLAEKAITLASDDEGPLLAECHFYLFAHSPGHRKESG